MAGGGGIIHIENDAHFQQELDKAGEKLVVVDFFATWYYISMIRLRKLIKN